ncbi:MinD/ParA family protein [Nocardioides marmoriginsengisoli]|uniref:MinD/ParA family protein n=1 Tax=Nocardioides marmoriginsengisoli TaxID=661483 RepID=A0A3N0CMU7_9ACTN|nr:P-loop NTPase [Nocardioides marmoriginsengisoli]RNL64233.1 MinD/ParA family protein [Nocardioides marmoriginsengisoli]
MPVLVEPDAGWATALAVALPLGTQVVEDSDQLAKWLVDNDREYVVLIGPSTDLATALAVGAALRSTHPALGVVLLREQATADVFQAAMQVGVTAVASAHDQDSIAAAVDRSRQTWEAIRGPIGEQDGREGKVITVFSPKGGVGKTTVAVNLAVALSSGGAYRSCIVDLDLAFGDVAITLQVIPDHTISEAIEAEEHLDFSLLETLLTVHENCSILAAPTHPEAKDRVSPALVRRVLRILREQFDYVVVDTSPAFDDQVLHAFDETDDCILVATLDVPTVKNVKVAIETLDALNLVEGRRHLLLNRADDEVGLSPQVVEGLLKMKVTTALPSALAVANATNHGRPIVLSRPDHPVSKALVRLAQDLRTTNTDGSPIRSAHARPVEPAPKRRVFGRRRK